MLLSNHIADVAFQAAHGELQALEAARFDREDIAAVQRRKLAALWDRARATRYYGPRLPAQADALSTLPVTPKALVKGDPEQFATAEATAVKYYETSGTSGRPTIAPRTVEDIVWNTVAVAGAWKRILGPRDRVASLLPSDVAPIGDLISYVCEYLGACLVRCYPFAIGMTDWDRLEAICTRFRPNVLFVAPGVILQFMRILKHRGRFAEVRASVERIALLGEVSSPSLRRMLAAQWQAAVYDASYGSTETGTLAATCEAGRLHILAHGAIAEVLIGDAVVPATPGVRGELVVTPLNTYARALLRYATGDLVEISADTDCLCGLTLPGLRVFGRQEERVAIGGRPVDVDTLEDAVYALPGITGYLLELDPATERGRLLLERDVDTAPVSQDTAERFRAALDARGLAFDRVVVLHQLPSLTKSGAGQKNWKKTNVRLVTR